MQDSPSAQEIIEAVTAFINNVAAPQLDAHGTFHARVAVNLLATLGREQEMRPAAERAEMERLKGLVGDAGDQSLDALNAKLCQMIAAGELDASSAGLMEHLKSTTIDQLTIDQPKYSGLKVARDTSAKD